MANEPVSQIKTSHDPKLVAALASLVKRLEATPEELRGPFLVQGLKPYLHPSSSIEGVKVKPLAWSERRVIEGVNWAWDAKSSIGWYIVATASGEGCKGSHYWFVAGEAIKGWANSEAEAKAAAQANYSNRILASLDLSPKPLEITEGDVAKLRERVARIEEDRDERWSQAEVAERKLLAVLPVLEWARRQPRKPFGVTTALDTFFSEAALAASLKEGV